MGYAMGYSLDCLCRGKKEVQDVFFTSVLVPDYVIEHTFMQRLTLTETYSGYKSLASLSLGYASQRGSPFSSLTRPAKALVVRRLLSISDGWQGQQMPHVQ